MLTSSFFNNNCTVARAINRILDLDDAKAATAIDNAPVSNTANQSDNLNTSCAAACATNESKKTGSYVIES